MRCDVPARDGPSDLKRRYFKVSAPSAKRSPEKLRVLPALRLDQVEQKSLSSEPECAHRSSIRYV